MLKIFTGKKFNKFSAFILNSKITYFVLILIILIQFILISIIFLQNRKSKYLIEQTNFKTATVESQQKQLNENIKNLQSSIRRLSSQIYQMKQSR
ncbi:MAG: hypothetical protein U9R14_01660 [Patescibacteria group bacterium]|nr:hypothetical protein [Patescibacteria group bacterium]